MLIKIDHTNQQEEKVESWFDIPAKTKVGDLIYCRPTKRFSLRAENTYIDLDDLALIQWMATPPTQRPAMANQFENSEI